MEMKKLKAVFKLGDIGLLTIFSTLVFISCSGGGGGNSGGNAATLPPALQVLEDLVMTEDAPGSGFWVIALTKSQHRLLEIVPDAWQGNTNLYPYDGTVRVGHLWSQFLMFSPGQWLTDRVESEGEQMLSFEVLEGQAKIIHYKGEWAFRDLL